MARFDRVVQGCGVAVVSLVLAACGSTSVGPEHSDRAGNTGGGSTSAKACDLLPAADVGRITGRQVTIKQTEDAESCTYDFVGVAVTGYEDPITFKLDTFVTSAAEFQNKCGDSKDHPAGFGDADCYSDGRFYVLKNGSASLDIQLRTVEGTDDTNGFQSYLERSIAKQLAAVAAKNAKFTVAPGADAIDFIDQQLDACLLLPQADAEQIIGSKQAPVSNPGRGCFYSPANAATLTDDQNFATNQVLVDPVLYDFERGADQNGSYTAPDPITIDWFCSTFKATPVSGIGDKACAVTEDGIYVLALQSQGHMVGVLVSSGITSSDTTQNNAHDADKERVGLAVAKFVAPRVAK